MKKIVTLLIISITLLNSNDIKSILYNKSICKIKDYIDYCPRPQEKLYQWYFQFNRFDNIDRYNRENIDIEEVISFLDKHCNDIDKKYYIESFHNISYNGKTFSIDNLNKFIDIEYDMIIGKSTLIIKNFNHVYRELKNINFNNYKRIKMRYYFYIDKIEFRDIDIFKNICSIDIENGIYSQSLNNRIYVNIYKITIYNIYNGNLIYEKVIERGL